MTPPTLTDGRVAIAGPRLSTVFYRPRPLTTPRSGIDVISPSTWRPPLFPSWIENRGNKWRNSTPTCSPRCKSILPAGKGAGEPGVAACWAVALPRGGATLPRASTTVWTGAALFEWLLNELCWSRDKRDITICPLTWSVSVGFALVKSNRWSEHNLSS